MNSRVIAKNFTFGAFQLDPTRHLLLRDSGEVVPLTPKAFDLLLLLVESGGRLLTKAELMNKLWPDSFVEEGNLTQTVSVLRKTLGENVRQHRYIVTVPGQGYRFVAEVYETREPHQEQKPDNTFIDEAAEDTAPSSPRPMTLAASDWGKYQVLLAAAGVLIVLLLGWVGYELTRPTAMPKSATEVKSVAVLPFKNIGGAPDEDYLGQGLAEVLVTKLSHLKTIIVRPNSAALKYADASPDPKKFGSELQVEAVIMGRVQKVGENIRVTAQLVRVSDGATLWAETFDDKFTNIFAVQDSLSAQVADSLSVTLTNSERQQLAKRDTANIEAFQLYLQGRYFWNKRTPESLLKAVEQFEKAKQLDPNYALAYIGLADCYVLLAEYSVATPQEAFTKAKAAIRKALEIDEQLAEAHTALAYTQAFYDWDWAGAEQSFKRALALNPNDATAHQWYAEYLEDLGRFDEAHMQFEDALQIDPVSLIIAEDLASYWYNQRKYDQAIMQAQKCIGLDPNFAYGYVTLGFAYEQKGMYPEAVDAIAKAMTLFGEPPECAEEVKEAFAKNGIKGFWKKRLRQAETRPHLKNFPAQSRAFVYARIGDKEDALEWLNISYQRRERFLTNAKIAPDFDLLRQDPRFQDLLRRLKL